jgi:phosphosulfolactate synthase (CoM biosynthesis protein A)
VFPPESLAGLSYEPRATRVAAGDYRIFVREDADAVLAEARAALPDDLAVSLRARAASGRVVRDRRHDHPRLGSPRADRTAAASQRHAASGAPPAVRGHRCPARGNSMTANTPTAPRELAFAFLRANHRPPKPRTRGVTEIRGPYYSAMGPHYLKDVLDTMGEHVDALKFAGGSFTLMPEPTLRQLIEIAHEHDVLVSTGGFIEHVLTQGPDAVDRYIDEIAHLGFDILEISAGFISIPTDDILRLVERAQQAGLRAKPEVGIQFRAGGASAPAELAQDGTRDVGHAIELGRRCLAAGAYMIMIESEGITEEVTDWRTDVVAAIAHELGLEKVMFEAADPAVFDWYVKNYGPEVNLFVDHSQIVQLECLRRGVWGTKSLWGRVTTYPEH